METMPPALPLHMQMALAEDIACLAALDLGHEARMAVFRYCAISASAKKEEWVDLMLAWGLDPGMPIVMRTGEATQGWLWHAMARGKMAQALALVERGVRGQDVDSQGRSGLGVLIESTYHDHLPAVLSFVEDLAAAGMSWQLLPDALELDAVMRKNVGSSLGELLSSRAHDRLERETASADSHAEFHRL